MPDPDRGYRVPFLAGTHVIKQNVFSCLGS